MGLEFICPDLFNKAAYDRDDAVMAQYPIDPKDARWVSARWQARL
jgi:hypothetical protein